MIKIQNGSTIVYCESFEEAVNILGFLNNKYTISSTKSDKPITNRTYHRKKLVYTRWNENDLKIVYQNRKLMPFVLHQLPELKKYSKSTVAKASWAANLIADYKQYDKNDEKMTSLFVKVFTELRDKNTLDTLTQSRPVSTSSKNPNSEYLPTF